MLIMWTEEKNRVNLQVFLTTAVGKPGLLQGTVQLLFLHTGFIDVLIINSDDLLKGKGIFKLVFMMIYDKSFLYLKLVKINYSCNSLEIT